MPQPAYVRVAATLKQMNNSEAFPVVEGEGVWIKTKESPETWENVQDLFDNQELGGLKDPTAANKILKSANGETAGTYVWQEADASLANFDNTSTDFQSGSDVSTAIGNALTADFGANHDVGDIVLNNSGSGSVQVGPDASGITLAAAAGASTILVGGSTASSNVTITSSDVKIHNVSVATTSDVSTSISTAMSGALGANYASGELAVNQITLTSASPAHTTVIGPAQITIDGTRVATMTDIAGVQWTVSVLSQLPQQGEERVLYLIPNSGGPSQDIYEEYIWVVIDNTTNPVTYGFEKIGDTKISLAASDITYSNIAQTGVTNVAGSLDQLITDFATLNEAIDLTIKSYTMSGSALEVVKGTTIAAEALTFSWTVNKPLTAITFDGASLATSATSAKNSAPVTATKTFTLNITSGSQTASKSITVNFRDRVYYGSAATGTYDSSFVLGLSNNTLKSSYSGSYPITVATNQYGFIAFPSAINAPSTCKIGGFDTEMVLAGTFDVVVNANNTTEYKLYRTANHSLGSLTLVY